MDAFPDAPPAAVAAPPSPPVPRKARSIWSAAKGEYKWYVIGLGGFCIIAIVLAVVLPLVLCRKQKKPVKPAPAPTPAPAPAPTPAPAPAAAPTAVRAGAEPQGLIAPSGASDVVHAVEDIVEAATGKSMHFATLRQPAPLIREGRYAVPDAPTVDVRQATSPPGVPRLDDVLQATYAAAAGAQGAHVGIGQVPLRPEGGGSLQQSAAPTSLRAPIGAAAVAAAPATIMRGAYNSPAGAHIVCIVSEQCGYCKQLVQHLTDLSAKKQLPCSVWLLSMEDAGNVPPRGDDDAQQGIADVVKAGIAGVPLSLAMSGNVVKDRAGGAPPSSAGVSDMLTRLHQAATQ